MRKHFTLTCMAVFSFVLSSQSQVLNKGDKLFGGSFSFSVFNNNESGPNYYNTGNVGLFPSFGWAMKNNLVFGVQGSAGFSRSQTSYNVSDKRTVTSFSFGPGIYIRKYKELRDRFGLYFNHGVNANYGTTKEKLSSSPGTKYEFWGGSYSFSPGVFYKFSEHFFGEANIGGLFASYSSNGNSSNYGIGASFLQYFNLGINYRIPRKNG